MIGGGIGALAGGGMGLYSSKGQDPKAREKATLVGAITGGGLGAFTGALASGASTKALEKVLEEGWSIGRQEGALFGANKAREMLIKDPGSVLDIINKVSPEARRHITRGLFGGGRVVR